MKINIDFIKSELTFTQEIIFRYLFKRVIKRIII